MEDSSEENERRQREAQHYWDGAASAFDLEPDHGLRDPKVREAWTNLLKTWLPPAPSVILDAGCGTGSLSVILAGLGHHVTGIDFSPAMIAQAAAKAAAHGRSIAFHVMDAAAPQFPPRHFDALICRHLLWTLPERAQVLQRWVELLKMGGRLVLIEGYWHTGAGLHAGQMIEALPASLSNVFIQNLSDQPDLWGGAVADERYAIRADLRLTAPPAES